MRSAALVTGSSRGLGKAISEALIARGRLVFGCARSASAITHTDYIHVEADLVDAQSVEQVFARIRQIPDVALDLVVHNAGVSQRRLAVMTSGAEADALVRGNLLAAFFVNREAMKLMRRRRSGRIINLSSINVRQASIGSALYNASKAGIENMTRTLSRECGEGDITVNCLGLSLVEAGGMAADVVGEARAERTSSLVKPTPLSVDEVVDAIEFFASPSARAITGETLYFGGGG